MGLEKSSIEPYWMSQVMSGRYFEVWTERSEGNMCTSKLQVFLQKGEQTWRCTMLVNILDKII